MPLKTNIGVSRKVADNKYGSRGANVNLEVELDSTLINEPERFHDRIRQVFRLAQQAIDEELTRQQADGTASHTTNGAVRRGFAGVGFRRGEGDCGGLVLFFPGGGGRRTKTSQSAHWVRDAFGTSRSGPRIPRTGIAGWHLGGGCFLGE